MQSDEKGEPTMTRDQFLNATRLLWNLDQQDLVDGGVIDISDWPAWELFKENPHRWMVRADDNAMNKLWALMRQKSNSFWKATQPIVWEDISHLLCHCGKDHCDANNHAPDHDMSADRYVEEYGCGTKEVYESAERIVAYVNNKFVL